MDPWRAYFEHLAQEWDAMNRADREPALQHILQYIDSQICDNAVVLDVGTGTGAIIPHLKERFAVNTLLSIDLATEMLLRAQQKTPKAFLVQTDVHFLPFTKNSFTSVICHNSFPHFVDKKAALVEIKRALKPGGKLFIVHDISRKQVNHIHANSSSEYIRQDILPPGNELAAMLQKTGFELLKTEDEATHFLFAGQLQNPDQR